MQTPIIKFTSVKLSSRVFQIFLFFHQKEKANITDKVKIPFAPPEGEFPCPPPPSSPLHPFPPPLPPSLQKQPLTVKLVLMSTSLPLTFL